MIGVLGASGRVGRHVAGGLADRRRRGARAGPRSRPRRPADPGRPRRPSAPARCRGASGRRAAAAAHAARARAGPAGGGGGGRRRSRRRAPDRQGVRRRGDARTQRHHADRVAHWRSEQRIERAGLGFTFLRPSFFMQNLLATVGTRRSRRRLARGAVRATRRSPWSTRATSPPAPWPRCSTATRPTRVAPDRPARCRLRRDRRALGVRYADGAAELAAARDAPARRRPPEVEHALRMAALLRQPAPTAR